ncbi:SAM-dependent methyltransferase [Chitinophaga rhizophila]|uniref:PRMT5 arginine-N-methyltransferase domain-containing protein n=1 Tax=Chitinophaga rhizophila TaxID=2866212 RepID=A0ABS7GC64_9BACT|nr:hypothetical protein [Chitinophaga rhizophila]MBW8685267.1 hypothetical protein [Chitinophaga rhizophila]
MTKEALRQHLQQYSTDILAPEDFHDRLAPAVMGYADLLSGHFAMDEADARTHIKTAHGNAIGTFWAARCMREVFRTQRFSRGLHQAVSAIKKRTNRTVHVLYAGTGPFAALALPVIMACKPEEVQFTFLEINAQSIDLLKQVIDVLDVHAYVRDIYQCDAATWEVPSTTIDIVISETMDKALKAEPQVAIMLNLASQLPEETIFLPEEIMVSLARWDRSKKAPTPVAELMRFNKSMMRQIIDRSSHKDWVFEDQQVTVDLSADEQLYFTTEVHVNAGNSLLLNDSSLNLPERVRIPLIAGIMHLNCRYSVKGTTGFKITRIDG